MAEESPVLEPPAASPAPAGVSDSIPTGNSESRGSQDSGERKVLHPGLGPAPAPIRSGKGRSRPGPYTETRDEPEHGRVDGENAGAQILAPPGLPLEGTAVDVDMEHVSKSDAIKAMKAIVDAELGKALPADVTKHVRNQTLELQQKIQMLQKTNALIDKTNQAIELMNAQRPTLPKGYKKVYLAFDSPLLDQTPTDDPYSADGITIDRGRPVREVKEALHILHTRQQAALDMVILKARRDELRQYTKKSVFVARCLQAGTKHSKAWEQLDLIQDDGDEFIPDAGFDPKILEARCLVLCGKAVRRIAEQHIAKKKAEDAAGKSRDAVIEAVLKKSPEELLSDTIDQKVSEALKKKNKKDKTPKDSNVDAAAIFVARTTGQDIQKEDAEKYLQESIPKNGQPPARSGGKNSANGKGNAKGKNNKSGKGAGGKSAKGKGKYDQSQNSSSSVKGGKGKGKGKFNGSKGKGKKGGKTSKAK
eukprot:TRINITY_DN14461_c1_g1_i1.p1 TRINITY_DN14461_c1_g1~~TRINITY_DN14461_c1_g1_i1.p1  ORF type:complete len:477 (-),score=131.81 TRINITY_DN14461_c1_g1_i1:928-2358(-)